MQEAKEIKNIESSKYFKKANLHTHSTCSDGKVEFDELICQAQNMGLEHFSICDHNTVEGYRKTKHKNCPILIPAVEFDCISGHCLTHIIGYGIDIESEHLKPYLDNSKFDIFGDFLRVVKSRSTRKIIEAIHKANGLAVLAHPCCCYVLNLKKFVKKLKNQGLDGIEVYYPYRRHRGVIKFHSRKRVKEYAQEYDLIMTGGTDEHDNLKF